MAKTQESALAVAIQGGEVQGLPIKKLAESGRNPRKSYPPEAHKEMVESIRRHGVLAPLVVRPMDEKGECYEILCGSRRYRAARELNLHVLPCNVVHVSDDDAFEIMVVENLQRQDVHPLEEAEGFRHLLEVSNGDTAGVALKTAKPRSYIAQRLKLLDLVEKGRKLFLDGHMTVDHAIQLARLPEQDQKSLLEMFRGDEVPTLSSLRRWIEENVMLDLAKAPWDKGDKNLVAKAGSCNECPKRTGCAKDLFSDVKAGDRCTDGACFKTKMQAHIDRIQRELESKGHKVVGLWTQYQSKAIKGTIAQGHYTVIDPRRKVKPCDKVVKGVFLDGPVPGVAVDVCPDDTCALHMNRSYHGKDPVEREKSRKEALKQSREKEIRFRLLRTLFETPKLELGARELQFVASFAFDRLWHDAKGRLVSALGWKPEKKKGEKSQANDFSYVEKRIKDMGLDEVNRFLLALALSKDLDPRYHGGGDLRQYAENYGLKAKEVEAAVDAALAAKRKPASRKKGPDTAGADPKTNGGSGAEKKSPSKKPAKAPKKKPVVV